MPYKEIKIKSFNNKNNLIVEYKWVTRPLYCKSQYL